MDEFVVVHFGSDCPHCQGDQSFEECVQIPGVRGLQLCFTKEEVSLAIARITDMKSHKEDWSLFQRVSGKLLSRAVTFERDGRTVREIT